MSVKGNKKLETDYFSLPQPAHLTVMDQWSNTDQQQLDFIYGAFLVRLRIEVHAFDEAVQANDFLAFFNKVVVTQVMHRKPIVSEIALGGYNGYWIKPYTKNIILFLAAIQLNPYQYLIFRANYRQPLPLDAEKEAEINKIIWGLLHSIAIKDDVVNNKAQEFDVALDYEEKFYRSLKAQHIKSYRKAAEQAADCCHLRYYPEQFSKLEKFLSKYKNLPDHAVNGIYNNALLSIGFAFAGADDYSAIGNTRFYGLPDLPAEIDYPKVTQFAALRKSEQENAEQRARQGDPYLCQFIAQINCAELAHWQDYLPRRGVLYFFIESQSYYGDGFSMPYRIIYYDGAMEGLQSAKTLKINPDTQILSGSTRPARVKAIAQPYIMENSYYEDYSVLDDLDEETQRLQFPYPPPLYDVSPHVMMALGREYTVFSNSINVGGAGDDMGSYYDGSPFVRAALLFGGQPHDYMLLLDTCADKEINGFKYGEYGEHEYYSLYFVIAKEKLKALDFSQVYVNTRFWWHYEKHDNGNKYWIKPQTT